MLTRIIDWSLRHRWLVIGATLALALAGVARLPRSADRRLPRHDAGPGPDQHRGAGARRRSRSSGRSRSRSSRRSPACPNLTEVRSISKFGFSQVTHRSTTAPTSTSRGRWSASACRASSCRPASSARARSGRDGPGRGLPLPRDAAKARASPSCAPSTTGSLRRSCAPLPGVAEVNAWGGDEKQFHVVVDPCAGCQKLGLDARGSRSSARGEQRERRRRHARARRRCEPRPGHRRRSTTVGDLERHRRRGARRRAHSRARRGPRRGRREIRRGAVTADGTRRGRARARLHAHGREQPRRHPAARAHGSTRSRRACPTGVEVEPVYDRTELVDHVLHTVRQEPLRGRAARHRGAVRRSSATCARG